METRYSPRGPLLELVEGVEMLLVNWLVGDAGERVSRAEIDPSLVIIQNRMDLSSGVGQHRSKVGERVGSDLLRYKPKLWFRGEWD